MSSRRDGKEERVRKGKARIILLNESVEKRTLLRALLFLFQGLFLPHPGCPDVRMSGLPLVVSRIEKIEWSGLYFCHLAGFKAPRSGWFSRPQ
jgi:hypothetical protein